MSLHTSAQGGPAASATATEADPVVLVGLVGAPFGVKGWTHVRSYTDPPDNLLEYAPWQLRSNGDASDIEWQPIEVEAGTHANGLIARFAGVRDRDAAAELSGAAIGVAASVLPAPEVDEYYWRDLVGARVTNPAGEQLGEVRRLFSTPAHDVLVVVDGDLERLIPFVRQWVVAVLPETGQLVVDWEADWR